MSKVVSLSTELPPSSVNESAVELLEELLEKAKSGNLEAIAVACHYADDVSQYFIRDMAEKSALAAPMMALHYAYSRMIVEGDE